MKISLIVGRLACNGYFDQTDIETVKRVGIMKQRFTIIDSVRDFRLALSFLLVPYILSKNSLNLLC